MDYVAALLFAPVLDLSFEFAFTYPDWHSDALCQEHPEVDWFPERGRSAAPAKAVCQKCLVQSDCLAWALAQGTTLAGIWGGASQKDRKRLSAAGVTGDLIRKYGPYAIDGRTAERDQAIMAAIYAQLGAV